MSFESLPAQQTVFVTTSDGGNITQGTTTDAVYSGSGAGTMVAILKWIGTRLRGGQATMANSLPVVLSSDQSSIPVTATSTVTNFPASQPVTAVDGGIVAMGTTTDASWTTGAGTTIGLLKSIANAVRGTLGISGTVSVNSLPAGANTIGTVNVLPLPTGTNSIGTVTVSNFPASGGPITSIDGGLVAVGTTTDPVYSGSGAGTMIALLKWIGTRLRGGQATMANSMPVALPSDQSAIPVTGAFYQATQPVSGTISVTALPTGANTIGNVGLVAGASTIGNVGLVAGAAAIGSVTVTNTPTVNASSGAVVSVSGAASTNVGADTSYTFASQVTHMTIQNNTTATVYFNFDAAASQGTFQCVTGNTILRFDNPCTILHLYTAAAQTVNGSTNTGIVIKGWT